MGSTMTEVASVFGEFSSEISESMSPHAIEIEMAARLGECADRAPVRRRKEATGWIARHCGVPAARVKALLYREARRIEAWEADAIRAWHERLMAQERLRAGEVAHEIDDLKRRLAALEDARNAVFTGHPAGGAGRGARPRAGTRALVDPARGTGAGAH
jgi:hypothetical protein